jgi:TldD protein
MPSDVDADFLALPLRRLADAALQRARDFGVEHADFRFERLRSQSLRLRDGTLQGAHDGVDVGFAVRVILNGTWGFASTVELTPEAAVRTAEEAVRVAQVSAAISSERIELADEPVYSDVTWVSGYDIDPLSVPVADKVELLSALEPGADCPRMRSTTSPRRSRRCGEQVLRRLWPGTTRPRSGCASPAAGGARLRP